MEYRVLGPVEAAEGGRAVDLEGPLEWALLARLVLRGTTWAATRRTGATSSG